MKTATTVALLALAMSVGCAAANSSDSDTSEAAQTSAVALDVNDVSILFALPKKSAELPLLLGLDEHATNGVLLSKESFAALLGFAKSDQDATFKRDKLDDPKNWRIVAMRVEPCAKLDLRSPTCSTQLRLIAQAVTASGTGGSVEARDHAMHLIYDLGADQMVPMVRDLIALKTANASVVTNGAPLGVHPAMAAQGLQGKFATGVKDFIKKYAGESKMPFATVMLTLNAGTWRFARGEVVNGRMQQGAIPNEVFNTIELDGTTGTIGNFMDSVNPPATGQDNVNAIVDANDKNKPPVFQGSFFKLPADKQQSAIDAALRIDNPDLHTPATVDCVSCHMATRSLARAKDLAFLSAADGNPNRFKVPQGVTAAFTTSAQEISNPYGTRAFGYLARAVAITQGAANSSAKVANYINVEMIGKGLVKTNDAVGTNAASKRCSEFTPDQIRAAGPGFSCTTSKGGPNGQGAAFEVLSRSELNGKQAWKDHHAGLVIGEINGGYYDDGKPHDDQVRSVDEATKRCSDASLLNVKWTLPTGYPQTQNKLYQDKYSDLVTLDTDGFLEVVDVRDRAFWLQAPTSPYYGSITFNFGGAPDKVNYDYGSSEGDTSWVCVSSTPPSNGPP